MTRTVGSAGNKSFHPFQVGTFVDYPFYPAKGKQNGDEASPSIILAVRPVLVKMLIPLEPRGAFGTKCVYLCILTLSSHWYAKR